ncbi:MAG: 3-oxoacyl-[acyl-carrier-protein] reductase [bacterium]|nr:3-oxoacyl-[acyl-carrier-protein] reductase [bacterium]
MGFEGKVVLVTGGTRGIGYACAERFAREGALVALCGRKIETAEAAANQIAESTGGKVLGIQADVSCRDAVDAMVKQVRDELGPVHVLVNNAGITCDGLFARMKDDVWADVLNTDLVGVFYCCRAVSREMLKQRAGRIISISSIVGLRGQAGQANYAAAKSGLIGLTKSLAREFASRSITVNCIAPGYIETAMTADLPDAAKETILQNVPLGRAGSAEEVAGLIRFLASDDAAYITGSVIQVDGGLAM